MANKFIAVPAEAIEGKLLDKGFTAEKQGREVVYMRRGRMADRLTLKVYSSVTEGASAVRAKDTDAIRVVLAANVGEGKRPYILYQRKILRVNSVEGVLARIWEACAEAAQEGLKVRHVCPVCGAPAYSDTAKCIVKTCREKRPTVPVEQRVAARLADIEKRAGFMLAPLAIPTALKGIPSLTYNETGNREVMLTLQGSVLMVVFRTNVNGEWSEEKWAV